MMYSIGMAPTGRNRVYETHIMVRLTGELKDALQRLADKDRRKLSDYVRVALEDHAEREKKRK